MNKEIIHVDRFAGLVAQRSFYHIDDKAERGVEYGSDRWTVETKNGIEEVHIGDWVLMDRETNVYVMAHQDFCKLFIEAGIL